MTRNRTSAWQVVCGRRLGSLLDLLLDVMIGHRLCCLSGLSAQELDLVVQHPDSVLKIAKRGLR